MAVHRKINGWADYVAPSNTNSTEANFISERIQQFYVMVQFERTDVTNNMNYIESCREGIDGWLVTPTR